MPDDALTFKLKHVDLKTIAFIYPEGLSDGLQALVKQAEANGENAWVDIDFSSNVVITHPSIEDFNRLLAEFEEIKRTIAPDQFAQAELDYNSKVQQLGSKITNDIKSKFEKAILINNTTINKLKLHVDTLLYVCLALYEHHWDAYGTEFNGWVSEVAFSKLLPAGLPHHYLSIQQTQFISNLLYAHFKKPKLERRVSIMAGGQMHSTDDPILVDWLVGLIAKGNFPISMDYSGLVLSKLLKQRDNMGINEFLVELKKFTVLKADNRVDEKRKVVEDYCLAIHKIFSHYLSLPLNNLAGKRSTIYHNILLAFQMDDFREAQRHHENVEFRADRAANKLATAIRPEVSKLKCN